MAIDSTLPRKRFKINAMTVGTKRTLVGTAAGQDIVNEEIYMEQMVVQSSVGVDRAGANVHDVSEGVGAQCRDEGRVYAVDGLRRKDIPFGGVQQEWMLIAAVK